MTSRRLSDALTSLAAQTFPPSRRAEGVVVRDCARDAIDADGMRAMARESLSLAGGSSVASGSSGIMAGGASGLAGANDPAASFVDEDGSTARGGLGRSGKAAIGSTTGGSVRRQGPGATERRSGSAAAGFDGAPRSAVSPPQPAIAPSSSTRPAHVVKAVRTIALP